MSNCSWQSHISVVMEIASWKIKYFVVVTRHRDVLWSKDINFGLHPSGAHHQSYYPPTTMLKTTTGAVKANHSKQHFPLEKATSPWAVRPCGEQMLNFGCPNSKECQSAPPMKMMRPFDGSGPDKDLSSQKLKGGLLKGGLLLAGLLIETMSQIDKD